MIRDAVRQAIKRLDKKGKAPASVVKDAQVGARIVERMEAAAWPERAVELKRAVAEAGVRRDAAREVEGEG